MARIAELPELRNRTIKHYALDDGSRELVASVGPLHFLHKDTEEWTDLSELTADDGSGGRITFGADVTYQLTGSWLRVQRANRADTVSIRPAGLWLVDLSQPNTRKDQIASANWGNVTYAENRVTVPAWNNFVRSGVSQ